MFIYNLKLNSNLILRIGFIIIAIILILFFSISAYKIFSESIKVNDNISPDVINISSENYTNVLKSVHDNINDYLGKTISFTGYVYRVSDFTSNEFVLARDMIISSDLRTLVVGFLCSCDEINTIEDKTWVKITGRITKGNYHGEIPVIDVINLEKTEKPSDEYVYPPDSSYVPTVSIF